jgi:biopolymer transport protein ExbB
MFVDYMQKGGHLMWPLLFCSVLAGAVFLERALFYARVTLNLGEFMRGLANLIRSQRWAEAQVECASLPTPGTRVLHAAVVRHGASREELKAVVQEAGQLEGPRLEQRWAVLAGVGVVAPLIGLLGTVTGMIEVFSVIATQSGVTSSTELAGGIYQSLLTTAAGLAVAIPCAIGYAFLSARVNALLHDMERAGIEVVHLIVDQRGDSQIIDFGAGARAARVRAE